MSGVEKLLRRGKKKTFTHIGKLNEMKGFISLFIGWKDYGLYFCVGLVFTLTSRLYNTRNSEQGRKN